MKKFSLAFLLFISSLSAHEQNTSSKNKIYLSPSHIQIAQEGIFILLENSWVQTSQLQSDASGLFVEPSQFMPWYCDRCERWTSGWWVCEYCGNPK